MALCCRGEARQRKGLARWVITIHSKINISRGFLVSGIFPPLKLLFDIVCVLSCYWLPRKRDCGETCHKVSTLCLSLCRLRNFIFSTMKFKINMADLDGIFSQRKSRSSLHHKTKKWREFQLNCIGCWWWCCCYLCVYGSMTHSKCSVIPSKFNADQLNEWVK